MYSLEQRTDAIQLFIESWIPMENAVICSIGVSFTYYDDRLP